MKDLEKMRKDLGKLYQKAINEPNDFESERLYKLWKKKRAEYVRERMKADGLL